jgi:hypothetical protein
VGPERPPVTVKCLLSAESRTADDPGLEVEKSAVGRRVWRGLAAFAAYLVLAALAFTPVWTHWSAQMNGCDCWDQVLEDWFIAWPSAALAHGHSLWTSTYLNAPGGVNMMWNGAVTFLGVLWAPVVDLAGPMRALSIIMAFGFATSAAAMYLLLRRWCSPAAAWIGGLVYGFSSMTVAEGMAGRLHLTWLGVAPLVVWSLDHLLRDDPPRPLLWGSVAGALVAIQLLISEEIALLTVLFVAIGGGFALVWAASRVTIVRRGRSLLTGGVTAAGVALVLAAYPLYVQFKGPYRIYGPVQSAAQLGLFRADLLSPVLPGPVQMLDPGWAARVSRSFSIAPSEVTEYLGVPLILILLVGCLWLRRDTLARVFAPVLVVAFLLCLGPRVTVANHPTRFPGPDAALVHVPLVQQVVPSRFAVGMWFAAAVLLALCVDAAARKLPTRYRLVAPAAALASLIPMIPNWPYPEHPATLPSLFRTPAVGMIPRDALVAAYPYPVTSTAWAMEWQAYTGMRFRMLGGYVIGPDARGRGTFYAYPNPVLYCFVGVFQHGAPPPGCTPATVGLTFRRLGVTVVVADPSEPGSAAAASLIDRALGARPAAVGGTLLWRCVGGAGAAPCRWA